MPVGNISSPIPVIDKTSFDFIASFSGYASDICKIRFLLLLYHSHTHSLSARTWPVSGVFTPAQKALYQALLNVQKTCIPLCTESARVSLHDLHQRSSSLVSQELAALGFKLRYGDVDRVLYPHFLTHPVGIGTYRSDTILRIFAFSYWNAIRPS